ncbi:hypothetical protein JCM11641_001657 [Rhodosporidiobolus odoratus]
MANDAAIPFSLAALLLLLAPCCLLFFRSFYPQNLPPGPRASGFGWGNHRSLLSMPKLWVTLDDLGKAYPRGFYTLWFRWQPTIVVTSPRVATELLDKRSSKYSSRARSVVAGELMYGGQAIPFLPTNAKWRNQRRLYHNALSEKRMPDYHPLQEMEAKRLVHDLSTWEANGGVDWNKYLDRYVVSVLVAVAYGRRVDDVNVPYVQSAFKRMRELGEAAVGGKGKHLEAFPFLQSLPEFLTPYKRKWRAYREEAATFWLGLAETVKTRMSEGRAPPSFTRDLYEEGLTEANLDQEEFAILAGGFFAGGIETSSASMQWFILAMVTHPRVQLKAQEELDRVVGRDRNPTWSDHDNLPYMRALVQEVLRWRPVAILGGQPHATSEEDVYEGYTIPIGSTILCDTWSLHRDPDYFTKPDEFRPERYLSVANGGEGEGERYPQKTGHSAFGWGRRICPGMHVAQNSLWIAFAHILHHFTLSTPESLPAPDIFAQLEGFAPKPEPFPVQIVLRGGKAGRDFVEKEMEAAMEGLAKLPLRYILPFADIVHEPFQIFQVLVQVVHRRDLPISHSVVF